MKTLLKPFHWILSKLPLIKDLNGKKTLIGAVLFTISSLIGYLTGLMEFFPEVTQLPTVVEGLAYFFDQLKALLEIFGLSFIYTGVGHKAIKEVIEE